MDAAVALAALSDYCKQNSSFVPRISQLTTRWHAHVAGYDVEVLCTGPKFFDTRAKKGGGGALDLTMHLAKLDFKQAVALLRAKGL